MPTAGPSTLPAPPPQNPVRAELERFTVYSRHYDTIISLALDLRARYLLLVHDSPASKIQWVNGYLDWHSRSEFFRLLSKYERRMILSSAVQLALGDIERQSNRATLPSHFLETTFALSRRLSTFVADQEALKDAVRRDALYRSPQPGIIPMYNLDGTQVHAYLLNNAAANAAFAIQTQCDNLTSDKKALEEQVRSLKVELDSLKLRTDDQIRALVAERDELKRRTEVLEHAGSEGKHPSTVKIEADAVSERETLECQIRWMEAHREKRERRIHSLSKKRDDMKQRVEELTIAQQDLQQSIIQAREGFEVELDTVKAEVMDLKETIELERKHRHQAEEELAKLSQHPPSETHISKASQAQDLHIEAIVPQREVDELTGRCIHLQQQVSRLHSTIRSQECNRAALRDVLTTLDLGILHLQGAGGFDTSYMAPFYDTSKRVLGIVEAIPDPPPFVPDEHQLPIPTLSAMPCDAATLCQSTTLVFKHEPLSEDRCEEGAGVWVTADSKEGLSDLRTLKRKTPTGEEKLDFKRRKGWSTSTDERQLCRLSATSIES
ncbi:hypothetical protein CYLTODRAFT_449989 [Cylindrobasidium torrendii FP15055 ss-10]|uniref:Uncharacterized protein n=1 Tax=Cylindrobasidium torrendii FP15055 ss-10 TaxID=1314674 RepID=A0A0D7BRL4_9AGAR|nr:hypothetical protein CYLTODRAFT_449989 [Cylindrobasidium torrendii FP15055 ss-10]